VQAIFTGLTEAGAQVAEHRDPCVLPKALKNEAEQVGHRAAQARDGAAMVRFLHWLAKKAPQGGVDEISAQERLYQFRQDTGQLRDLSFDTISGAGPNGAVVHYRVSEESNRMLEPGSVYLVDSGGHIPMALPTSPAHCGSGREKHLQTSGTASPACSRATLRSPARCFQKGTLGSQLDPIARQFLWTAGLDYAHGTGHGVGSFLSVHEARRG